MKPMTAGRRLRDLFLEVVIAVALVTAFIVYLFSLPKGTRIDVRWLALAVNTATIFGFLIAWFREAWRRFAFWMTLVVLIFLHSAAYIFILSRIQGWPLSYYILLNPLEMAVFAPILRNIVSRNTKQI